MKMDEKFAKQIYEDLLAGYLKKMIENKLITRYDHSFSEDNPLINLTCYFDFSGGSGFKKNLKQLHVNITFSAVKDYNQLIFFVDHNTSFDRIEEKVIKCIDSRARGAVSEARAFKLLHELKKDLSCGICDIFLGSEYSDNTLGLDIVFTVKKKIPRIFFDEKMEKFILGFNVKSSIGYQKKHLSKHPRTPSLVCGPDLSDEEIKQSMKELIEDSLIFIHAELLISMIGKNSNYNLTQLSSLAYYARGRMHK